MAKQTVEMMSKVDLLTHMLDLDIQINIDYTDSNTTYSKNIMLHIILYSILLLLWYNVDIC